ncbi:DNA-binding transcriptional regulator, FadR family [Chitinophaga jiangningensis]|uniref:DNA-binding transcriptional regulator, FadR family n=1 Tax=Chitinophaga jiangningensis TaxID=1419482 RepID=A0A1M7L870_9BACT|nr:FCD domain-containing protein [Chitinophaga jiangningensis]SHM74118.1 DNA-binding transcriptional regulator, FadR family [Chitinophaga jiangningensis]
MEHLPKLSDKVINAIQKDISRGKYKPGSKIPAEPELMAQYGVGRSTIREAIKTLANSGILRVQQGAGTFVSNNIQPESLDQRLRRADFEEINQVRRMLDTEIVKLAAEHHTAAQLAAVEKQLLLRKAAIMANDNQACADADIAFHTAIARATQNEVLADLYHRFTAVIRDFFSKRDKQGVGHFAISHHLHEQLYKAIKAKKPKAALQVMQEIIDNNY